MIDEAHENTQLQPIPSGVSWVNAVYTCMMILHGYVIKLTPISRTCTWKDTSAFPARNSQKSVHCQFLYTVTAYRLFFPNIHVCLAGHGALGAGIEAKQDAQDLGPCVCIHARHELPRFYFLFVFLFRPTHFSL